MDYAELGFKCGLEIHQRLSTSKLFCDCYCDPNKETEPNETTRISRKLRPVVGELGGFDPAAAFESARGRSYVYVVDYATSCAVEADEEPPHGMNCEALKTVLVASRMLNAKILDAIFVMRKAVIDGSAVSGFQRTCLVALDGSVSSSKGEIGIPTIALEEESAGIVDKTGPQGEITYRLDRLGIPLIEIATAPTIKDGHHALEVAEKIGQLLRSTGKVQRGLGSIRQDLNVSIARGARVEIKGVQDLKLIPKMVDNEIQRQISLLKLRERLSERHILLGEEHFSLREVEGVFNGTSCRLIKDGLSRGEKVFGLKLMDFAGLFKTELMPSLTFGQEAAGYVRSSTLARGIIHSDEDLGKKYLFGISEIEAARRFFNMRENDLFVLCIGPEKTCKSALRVVFERCKQLQSGIPEETRRAEGEISVYMRPLPGPARMYPETDLLPVKITDEMLAEAEKNIPEAPETKKSRYIGLGLSEQLAGKMVRSTEWGRFEQLVKGRESEAQLVAITLLETLVSLKREGVATDALSLGDLSAIFLLYSKSAITKAAIPEIIKLKCANHASSIGDLVDANNLRRLGEPALREMLSSIEGSPEKKFADVLKKCRLQADPALVRKILEGKE